MKEHGFDITGAQLESSSPTAQAPTPLALFRWIAVVPTAVAAGAFSLFAFIMLTYLIPAPYTIMQPIVQVVQNLFLGYYFVYAGAVVAPRWNVMTSVVMAILLTLTFGMLLTFSLVASVEQSTPIVWGLTIALTIVGMLGAISRIQREYSKPIGSAKSRALSALQRLSIVIGGTCGLIVGIWFLLIEWSLIFHNFLNLLNPFLQFQVLYQAATTPRALASFLVAMGCGVLANYLEKYTQISNQ
jgi:hypothetical protein